MNITNGKRILIFDEESVLNDILGEHLEFHEQILITSLETKAGVLRKAKDEFFDIIIINSGPSDTCGLNFYNLLRSNGLTSHIILLTFPNTSFDSDIRAEAYTIDHITKPFRLGTLLNRILTHFRQQELGENSSYNIGPYNFQPVNKLLVNRSNLKEIYLTDKETAILKYLYNTSESVISKDVLLDEVWGYNEGVTTHTLETHIYRLRQKIETDSTNAKILVTEPGGYRLVPK